MRGENVSGLTDRTWRIVRKMFAEEDQERAGEMLARQCGNNLPFLDSLDEIALERFRFAVLKLSGGCPNKLRDWIRSAQIDWRDTLGSAGFAADLTKHSRWADAYLADQSGQGLPESSAK
jgi:hypothetical protein